MLKYETNRYIKKRDTSLRKIKRKLSGFPFGLDYFRCHKILQFVMYNFRLHFATKLLKCSATNTTHSIETKKRSLMQRRRRRKSILCASLGPSHLYASAFQVLFHFIQSFSTSIDPKRRQKKHSTCNSCTPQFAIKAITFG